MAKYKFNDYIANDIKEKKTLIELLPKNSINRQKKFNETIDEIEREYKVYQQSLTKFILYKYNKLSPKETHTDITKEKDTIIELEKILTLGNPLTGFMERLELDVLLYNLVHYYNYSINEINKNIKELINKFKEADISIKPDNFKLNPYEYVYMCYIFNEINTNIADKSVGNYYENIYWKCSKVFEYLVINFRYLIEKNKKKFIKYADNKLKSELTRLGFSSYHAAYFETQKLYKLIDKRDKISEFDFIQEILNNKINPDYYVPNSEERTKDIESLMVRKVTPDNPLEYNKMLDKIRSLRYNLIEYSNYLEDTDLLLYFYKKYKNLIPKSLTEDKDKNKKQKKEKINKKNSLKIDYNSLWKLSGNKFYISLEELEMNFKVNDKDLLFKQNNILETVYKQINDYDNDYFEKNIIKNIKENTTVGEIFELIVAFPYFTRRIIKDVFEYNGNNKEELSINKIDEIKKILHHPERKIIDAIPAFVEVNVPQILTNSFRFENLDLNEESFELSAITATVTKIEKLLLYYDICEFNTSITETKFIKEVTFLKNNNKI